MDRILERWRKIEAVLRAGGWAWTIFCWITGLTGAAVIAWASTTWNWYWTTFSFLGVAAAFLVGLFILAISFLLTSLGVVALRPRVVQKNLPIDAPPSSKHLPEHGDNFGSTTVTASPLTLAEGLYVSDMRFGVDDLGKNRRSEITLRVFNATGRAVELAELSGQVRFSAPNNTDPQHKGSLPTPTLRHDVARVAYPMQEWFLILEQRVPAEDADKLTTMLSNEIPIHIELNGLNLMVSEMGCPGTSARLSLWYGITVQRGVAFGRIINGSINITIGAA